MNQERDKFLTEAMEECWHERGEYYFVEDGNSIDSGFNCKYCKKDMYGLINSNFSTWKGFGKLLAGLNSSIVSFEIDIELKELIIVFEKVEGKRKTHTRWRTIFNEIGDIPNRFADAVWEFLKTTAH